MSVIAHTWSIEAYHPETSEWSLAWPHTRELPLDEAMTIAAEMRRRCPKRIYRVHDTETGEIELLADILY